ncbi:hypothetical protein Cpir12675_003457 [Ceratocystis pirilliformis]|uniref:PNPLA domain-containing protein n=1 Tax=Ceratocystis pirilliformis TaxID=259994 RepID=A0ABR3Z337_9PEZI
MPPTPLFKVLSFDGGGVRGLSSLLILERIMEHIQKSENLSAMPKPCQVFDLIGGTSTGGIIAIMLGRLEMPIDQCIRAYKKFAETAFTEKRRMGISRSPSGAFSAKSLEKAIKQVIRENCILCASMEQRKISMSTADTCSHEDMPFSNPSCTKTAVLAITKDNVETLPTLFKTYDAPVNLSECKVWEVARATSASTTFFKPIKLGRDEMEFIDAGFGYNNPCERLIAEAREHCQGRPILTLSIGTGLGDVVEVGKTKNSIIKALKEMATTSKTTALRLVENYGGTGLYYRFNVENGLKDITLSDWKLASKISSHTNNYLQERNDVIQRFISAMRMGNISQVSRFQPELEGNPQTWMRPAELEA